MGILLDNMYLSVTSCTAGLLVNRHRDDPSTCHLRESTEELAGLLLLAIIDLKVKKNPKNFIFGEIIVQVCPTF